MSTCEKHTHTYTSLRPFHGGGGGEFGALKRIIAFVVSHSLNFLLKDRPSLPESRVSRFWLHHYYSITLVIFIPEERFHS